MSTTKIQLFVQNKKQINLKSVQRVEQILVKSVQRVEQILAKSVLRVEQIRNIPPFYDSFLALRVNVEV